MKYEIDKRGKDETNADQTGEPSEQHVPWPRKIKKKDADTQNEMRHHRHRFQLLLEKALQLEDRRQIGRAADIDPGEARRHDETGFSLDRQFIAAPHQHRTRQLQQDRSRHQGPGPQRLRTAVEDLMTVQRHGRRAFERSDQHEQIVARRVRQVESRAIMNVPQRSVRLPIRLTTPGRQRRRQCNLLARPRAGQQGGAVDYDRGLRLGHRHHIDGRGKRDRDDRHHEPCNGGARRNHSRIKPRREAS